MNRMDMLKTGTKKLVVYLMAGDPGLKETEELIVTLAQSGVSLVELGIPFSDPIADGPVIQKAGERALKRGVTIDKCLKVIENVRKKGIQVPIVAMTYYNLIHHYGSKRFVDSALKAGLDGAIIPDLPFDEEAEFHNYAKKRGFNLVYLVAPSNTMDRAKKIVEKSRGFVYYILQKGVTGGSKSVNSGFHMLQHVKTLSKIPVFAGFGVSDPLQAKEILKIADGVIIGSAFVSLCEKYGKNRNMLLKNAKMFVKKFLNV